MLPFLSWCTCKITVLFLTYEAIIYSCLLYTSDAADEATFSSKLNVEQATEVNANKHLLVLNILSIKYSMYDVKCDVNYCVYTYCPK